MTILLEKGEGGISLLIFMMKKFFALLLVICLACSFTACKSSKSTLDDDYTITVNEGIFNTKISIPKVFATSEAIENSDNPTFKIADIAKQQNVKKVTTNNDGSVSLKMSNSTYKTFLTKVKVAIDQYNDTFISDNAESCSFTEIAHDINLSEFNVKADSAQYTASDVLSTNPFYFFGMLYQGLSGTDADSINTTVNILDKDTENLIHVDSLSLRDYTEVLKGNEQLSTEAQTEVTTTAATAMTTTAAADASASSTDAASSTTASDGSTTTTTAATTASTATTATTASSTPGFNTSDQSKQTSSTTVSTTASTTATTTASTTAATTAATTASTSSSQGSGISGSHSDTGAGSITLDSSVTGTPSSTSYVTLKTSGLDDSLTSYIYIDGALAASTKLTSVQAIELQGSYLTSGTHKMEIVQYDDNNPNRDIVTYKSANYTVTAN